MSGAERPNPCWVAPDDDPDRSALYLVDGYTMAVIIRSDPGVYRVWSLSQPVGIATAMPEAREIAISALKERLGGIVETLAFLLTPNKEAPNVD